MDWSKGFKIDISGGNDSGRWLYRGAWLMPLSKSASVGFYQIKNYQKFELVLSITHNKSMVHRPSKLGLDSLTLVAVVHVIAPDDTKPEINPVATEVYRFFQ